MKVSVNVVVEMFKIISNETDIYVDPSDILDILESEEQNKQLKKLINSQSISCKDSVMGRIICKNILPIVCCVNSHKEAVFFQNNYSHRTLDFSNIDTSTICRSLAPLVLSEQTITILSCYMTLLGGLFSLPSDSASKKLLKPIIPHDNILNDFLDTCTDTESPDDFVYADTLYQAYCDFFSNKYHAMPLKRTQLVKKLKLTGRYLYKRPHVSRNCQNKYAFCGLKLKQNWEETINASDKNPYSFEKAAFIEKLYDAIKNIPFPEEFYEKQPINISIVTQEC